MNSADLLMAPRRLGRVAEALDAILRDASQTEIARGLGVAVSTVGRRGADLSGWPANDLLHLAAADADLRAAVVAAIGGWDERPGDAVAAPAHALEIVGSLGETLAAISRALRDGKITAQEARTLDARLKSLAEPISALRADLSRIYGPAR